MPRGQADLAPFFNYHPWLYLFLVPAIAMRLWAEERKQGTLEVLLTLPAEDHELVAGKFLASWTLLATGPVVTLGRHVNLFATVDAGGLFGSNGDAGKSA